MADRVLVISHEYLPIENPACFRWGSVAREWSKKGKEVHILCIKRQHLARFEMDQGVYVHRIGGSVLERVRDLLTGRGVHARACRNAAVAGSEMNFNGIRQKARRLHDLTWKSIYWPDYACTWFPAGVAAGHAILDKYNIEKLITTSWPFTNHLIGLCLKHYNANIEWLADIVDPFTLYPKINNDRLYKRLNYHMEKRVVRNCSSISVLTDRMKNAYVNLFSIPPDKIHVNPNLCPQSLVSNASDLKSNVSAVRLVFVGTLNPEIRSPGFLLEVFMKLLSMECSRRLELHIYGYSDLCENEFLKCSRLLKKNVFVHGVINKNAAIKEMSQADVLVNIGNRNSLQEPSKLIEYMSFCKPILNISSIPDDASIGILKEYPSSMTIEENLSAKSDFKNVLDFITRSHDISKALVDDIISPYQVESIANAYFRMLG